MSRRGREALPPHEQERRRGQDAGEGRHVAPAQRLAERGINIQAISTSEIKVSVMIDEDETELAVRVLHTAYGLDAPDTAGDEAA